MEPNKLVAQLSPEDRALIKVVQNGLPIVSRPYADIAERLSITEEDVIQRLQKLINNGAIKRYGVVVRHRELGYKANGMVVWDVPDDRVSQLGTCIGRFSCVTLSYRRPRRLPDWPYNLFTMVHGRSREEVEEKVTEIVNRCGLQDINHTTLFSTRRFKQRGASYTPPVNAAKPAASIQLRAVEETAS
ncbi:MAG: AsnC family transcriptional regulator [Gammaproteobacteria bacterium]|jgi:DNA-binding Lrp family transcriptional regulator